EVLAQRADDGQVRAHLSVDWPGGDGGDRHRDGPRPAQRKERFTSGSVSRARPLTAPVTPAAAPKSVRAARARKNSPAPSPLANSVRPTRPANQVCTSAHSDGGSTSRAAARHGP